MRANSRKLRPPAYSAGVTLIELLVAMIISLVVIGAASTIFLISSQSFTSVDSNSQLQDSSRFATYILRRMIQQVGYEDFSETAVDAGANQTDAPDGGLSQWLNDDKTLKFGTCSRADLCGFNDKVVKLADIRSQLIPTATTGSLSGGYFTDTLVVQFQGRSVAKASSISPKSGDLSATDADGSMIDCGGNAIPSSTVVPPAKAMSVINIAINSVTKEPELGCSFLTATGVASPTWPLIKGVESFQVMYEVGDDTSDPKKPRGTPDKFRWLRADQVETFAFTQPPPKDMPKAVFAWQNVVAVRFGLVIRGDLNSAPAAPSAVGSQPLYPLGSDLASAGDPGTIFVAPSDTRLRRVVTFTTHIRNPLATFRLTPPPPTP